MSRLPEEWTPPPPVPLRNQDPSEGRLIPYKVFGFPVLNKDLDKWADRLKIDPDLYPMTRQENSWLMLHRSVRIDFNCATTAIQLSNSSSMCIIIGSNKTAKSLARTQDMALIRSVAKAIRTRYLPNWFTPLDSRDMGTTDLGGGDLGSEDLGRGA